MIYFFKPQTYSCNGTEVRRPRGCEKLLQKAMDQGIITALDDVEINNRGWSREPTVTDTEFLNHTFGLRCRRKIRDLEEKANPG